MNDHPTDREFAERALRGLSAVEPSAGLMRRVAELPLTHAPQPARLWPFKSLWMPLFAGALATALGVTTGLATLDGDTTNESVSAAELTSDDANVDDVLVLAWGGEATNWDSQLDTETP